MQGTAAQAIGRRPHAVKTLWADHRGSGGYSTNYLIDTVHRVIVDVEGTRSIRQAEVGSVRTMLDRIKDRHDIDPEPGTTLIQNG
jgi:hypothetical protein